MRPRLSSIDTVRGAVMVLMALDHTRDFFSSAAGIDAMDPSHTWPALLLTRWVTHFCAPIFILLAGTGAYLSHKPKAELSRFLLTRGLWLVVLEVTVVGLAWTFDPFYYFRMLQVIWAIGWCMVVMSVLVYLPTSVIAAIGIAMIALHNLMDHVHGGFFWDVLHEPHAFEWAPHHRVRVAYPLVPWIGVIAAGYALGALMERPDRRRWLLIMGGAMVAAFVALRWTGVYGEPKPWIPRTALQFLNCTKYPPSLLYILMTIGPGLLALAALDGQSGGPLEVFGRVPLFYYVMHLYLIHSLRWIWSLFVATPGYDLPIVYAVWIAVVLMLYWPCLWYSRLKSRRRDLVWLSYL
jgi:uncharacterized membrane protein